MRSPSVPRLPSLATAVVLAALAGCGGAESPTVTGGGDATAVAGEPAGAPTSAAPGGTGDGEGGAARTPGPDTEVPASAAPSASASPAEEPSPSSSPGSGGSAPSAGPPFEADTQPDTEEPEGNGLTVTDVTVGRHDGYDRVVFTLGGQGQPGWRVEYVNSPTRQGSGDPFTPAGEAFLSVVLSGVGYPFDTGVQEYDGPRSIPGGEAEVVEEVQVQGVFEGQYDGAIGLTDRRPFRVFRLDGPPRVVVDVAHRG